MATVRKVSRALVISAFGWCGFKDFEKKRNEELSKKMERILDVLPLNEEPPNDDIRELVAIAKTLFADGGSFDVIDDDNSQESASFVPTNDVASEASDDDSDHTSEKGTEAVLTDAPVKRKRGRKPKPKPKPENETSATGSTTSTGGQVDTTDQTKQKGKRGRKPKATASETATTTTAAATITTKSRGRKPKTAEDSQTPTTGGVKLSHCVGHVLKKYGGVTDEGVSEVCSLLDLSKKERAAVRSCMESSMDVIRGYVSGVVKKTVEVLVLG